MAQAAVILLALIATQFLSCNAIQYLFASPQYTINEDGTTNIEVILQRTGDTPGDTSELLTQTQVVINTDCPAECPTMAGADLAVEGTSASGGDYSISSKTLTYSPNTLTLPISITVHDDNDEEFREYFCLSVADENLRGSQWSTRIIIPWNDHCVLNPTPPDEGVDDDAEGYYILSPSTSVRGYVGPWDTSAANPITINVTPQPTDSFVGPPPAGSGNPGTGNDLNIFLATEVDVFNFDTTFNYYGIHLDDTYATGHTNIINGDSWIADNDIEDDSLSLVETATEMVIEDAGVNTYELSYSSGTTTITRTSPFPSVTLTGTNPTTVFDIEHLFVSSAVNTYALWEICGLEPRRLPIVDAAASGSWTSFIPKNAVDNINSAESCWVSEADSNGKHWLQVDLGQEFEVKRLSIYNIIYATSSILDVADPEFLNNLQVYVGSCRPDDATDNNECNTDIGEVADAAAATPQGTIIDVTCDSGAYGRYVYLIPATDTNPFQICDLRVYGSEIDIADETKVFFTEGNSQVSVDEDVAGGQVTLQVSRTGSQSTCTYLEYYTDRSHGDFTEVLPAQELKITGATTSITIDITDDDICESTEDFNVYLTNIEGGILGYGDSLGSQCYATVHIQDDDDVAYSISVSDTSIYESNGPLNIQAVRTGEGISQDGSATLSFTNPVEDGACSNDYNDLDHTLHFSSSTNAQNYPVNIIDDECFEPAETFLINLDHLEPTCSAVGAGLPLQVMIIDNDSKFQWGTDTDVVLTLDEGSGSTSIDIIREGTLQTKYVEFNVNYDTAESGDFSITPSDSVTFLPSDSSESITVIIDDDLDVEGDEYFTVTLRDPLGGDCPNGNRGEDHQLHIRIRDNDGVYNWEHTAYSAYEGDGLVEVCLTRTADLTNSIDVQISTEPMTNSDINNIQQIRFQAGESRACGQVQISRDNIAESTETFSLTIRQGQGIAIGSQDTAVLTIYDVARVGWQQPSYVFSEAAGSSAEVFISSSGNSDVTVTVTSSQRTATSAVDFSPISTRITIDAQTTTHRLPLQIINDALDEPSESFILTLSVIDSSSASITQAETTITITDDDPTPTLPPTTPAPEGLSDGAIAGIAIGAVVGALTLAAIVSLFCWFYLRRGVLRTSAAVVGQTPQQGQLVPLGFDGNAYGAPRTGYGFGYPNNGYGYDNSYGNASSYGRNPYGI